MSNSQSQNVRFGTFSITIIIKLSDEHVKKNGVHAFDLMPDIDKHITPFFRVISKIMSERRARFCLRLDLLPCHFVCEVHKLNAMYIF